MAKKAGVTDRVQFRRAGFRRACVLAGLAVVSGCQSKKHVVLDNRPAWMMQAEQRLQGDKRWNVSGSDVANGGGSGPSAGRSSFFGGNRTAAPASSESIREGRSSVSETAAKSRQAPSSGSEPAAPPGVQWSETKITVEVED